MCVICFRFPVLVLYLALLAACGGGGGGSTAPPPTPAPAANTPPIAAFTLDVSSGEAPLKVTVDAANSSDSDGNIVSYGWDFAADTAIGELAQYTFEEAGTHTITLTVTDDDNSTDATSRTVTVNAGGITATVSGTVRILSSTAVDADVNDRLTLAGANNSFDDAQGITAPVTVGGFANEPQAGESTGNLFDSGDPGDFYYVSLNGGEVIGLAIAEPSADLDLRLWDEQRNLVVASLGTGPTESLEVVSKGNYFIEVMPYIEQGNPNPDNASNYVLYVGQDASSTSMPRTPSRTSDPFIAGQLIVKHLGRSISPAHGLDPLIEQRSLGRPGANSPGLYELLSAGARSIDLPAGARLSIAQRLRMHTLTALKALHRDPDVVYAELNMLAQAHAVPDDTFYGSQWHYPAINLPFAWDTTTGSNDVIVAVVDTGVLLAHPDLNDNLVPGYDFISSTERSLDGDGRDANPDDPGDLEFGGSSSFHGTHVAGTVAAESNNANGVAGVAWQARIMPLRALGKGGGSTFDIAQAVLYAAGLPNASGEVPAQPADIINLSLGTSFSSQSEQDAYTDAAQAGAIIIASAGNESGSAPSYPAAYSNVIAVSATTITNDLASYSNFGNFVDVAAPGGSNITDLNGDGIGDGVISTSGDDSGPGISFGYSALAGTSMAAPHVAGVAALMKAVHPGLTPAQFSAALSAGDLTDDLGAPGRDDSYGHGLINAQKSVFAAQQMAMGTGTDPGPLLSASASTLNFGSFRTTLNLSLQNVGTGDIAVATPTSTDPWVGFTVPTSADGLGEYVISVDRTGLADGAYQATLTFPSDANDIAVNIIMQVSQINMSADAGLMYIILVDDNGETVDQAIVSASQGEYDYVLTNVPAGQYRLFAGTDADDDAILCDAGEACGAYPTLDSPDFVAVNGDLDGLDFESGFRATLTATNFSRQSEGQTADQSANMRVDKSN